MNYVYILLSQKDARFYVGSTGDLKRRFQEHVGGKVESTRHRRPLVLIAYEAYLTKVEAERREKFLKTSDGKKDLRKRLIESLDQCAVDVERMAEVQKKNCGEVLKRLKRGDC